VRTQAVILQGSRALALTDIGLTPPGPDDVVVQVTHSGISTGTERLFWDGSMPPFPGMGYPLVPGYESAGEVMEAAPATGFRPGDRVFVPGANCFGGEARGLFGGASRLVVTPAARVTRISTARAAEGALFALAATARHAIAGYAARLPDLIIGHGTLGRLLARLTLAAGGPAPTVWETNPARRDGGAGYDVIDPATDTRRDYRAIYDASGAAGIVDEAVARLARGGEVVLAGFYTRPVAFAYPPAFMREARLRIASEWTPADMAATVALVDSGALSLADLVTHEAPAATAAAAYATAFTDPSCLKMILDWSAVQ
jgi:3-hydroxyethyl bacteriochlorophyllide a dehydrogenase